MTWNGYRKATAGMVLAAMLLIGRVGSVSGAQIAIDRMLAIVEGRVVTLNDVRRERELAQYFGDRLPDDDGAVLSIIIENILIDDQIRRFAAGTVEESEIDDYLARFPEPVDLPRDVVREAARARLAQAEFFEARFGRSSQATQAEVETYYQTVFVPDARDRGLDPIPPLAGALRSEIAQSVMIEKKAQAVSEWADSLVRRSEIEVVE